MSKKPKTYQALKNLTHGIGEIIAKGTGDLTAAQLGEENIDRLLEKGAIAEEPAEATKPAEVKE